MYSLACVLIHLLLPIMHSHMEMHVMQRQALFGMCVRCARRALPPISFICVMRR